MKTYFFHSSPSKNGRATIAAVLIDEQLHYGISRCRKNDTFRKKFGNDIALGRAIKNPFVTVNVEPEKSISKQFIEECLDILSKPVTDDLNHGYSLYNTVHHNNNSSLVGFTEEEFMEM
jgi:hypothetical protein